MKVVRPDLKMIEHAAKLLSQGHLIAVPTETVYGLAADAINDLAVAKIYEVKGRPQFNPLILHVESIEQAKNYAEFNELAETLAQTFWPGPLTLVLPVKENSGLSKLMTAGLETVAVRCPNHPMALDLIHAFGRPVAAPSANPSTKISPTSAQHVFDAFKGLNEPSLILDGGACKLGLESTVIDLTTKKPFLLRPGGLPLIALQEYCDVFIADGKAGIRAPGMMDKHYAPRHKLRMNAISVYPDEILLAFGPKPLDGANHTLNLSVEGDLGEAASNLFAMLHEIDQMKCEGIAVMEIPKKGLGLAINDRLKRAAS